MKYVAFDTETTGLEPGSRLVELAAIQFDESGVGAAFEELVNPGMPMPEDTAALNGISAEMLAGARTAKDVLNDFIAWLPPNAVFIAHWARFDTGILSWETDRCGITLPSYPVICTCELAKELRKTPNNKLSTLVEHYRIQRIGNAHRAMSDADACRQFWEILLTKEKVTPVARPWNQAGHDYRFPPELPPVLSGIPDLVSQGSRFSFMYTDAKDETTERSITPYGWADVKGNIMFHGWCNLRNARRTFRADRIQAIEKEAT